jgi:hypothetical protein
MDIERKVLTAPLEAVKADPTQIEQVLMDRRRIFRALSRMDSSGRDHAEIRRRGDSAETHDQLQRSPGHFYQRVFAGFGKRGRRAHEHTLPAKTVQSDGAGAAGAGNLGPDQTGKGREVSVVP